MNEGYDICSVVRVRLRRCYCLQYIQFCIVNKIVVSVPVFGKSIARIVFLKSVVYSIFVSSLELYSCRHIVLNIVVVS
jgi:hypothetical protein